MGPLRIPEHVVRRTIADETVILNLRTGRYHGVDAMGERMLAMLGDGRTAGDVARAIADEFAEPIERVRGDVDAFVQALAERGLVEAVD